MAMATTITACGTGIAQRKPLIIEKATDMGEQQPQEPYGKYRYEFQGTEFKLFSDSTYAIGDTLTIGR